MTRLIELDWLRVLVFGLLILYHTGMLYTQGWGWHFKSSYQSEFLANLMLWSNQWRMSLLFFISGSATAFLLARDSSVGFARKRIPQLLLPLVFGMLVVVVPQVYVEANSTGVIVCPDYWHFWYIYLDQHSAEFAQHKTLGAMHLTWNHLWFLPYILAYSLIVWAAYPLLRARVCSPLWQFAQRRLGFSLVILLPIIGHYLIGFFLYAHHPVTHNFVDDWFNHARSFFCFVLGFALVRRPDLWQKFAPCRWPLLVIALATYSYCLFDFHGGLPDKKPWLAQLSGLLWSANLWLWVLCVIAWAQQLFTRSTPLLRYLNKAVFCFYVLHQTLIIVFAYWLAPLALGPVLEPLLILLLVVAFCWILFELIRRLPLLPIFFGIKNT